MKEPLLYRTHLKPFWKALYWQGAFFCMLLLITIRGWHSLTDAWSFLFTIDKSAIYSHDLEYSAHDLWNIQAGLFAFIGII